MYTNIRSGALVLALLYAPVNFAECRWGSSLPLFAASTLTRWVDYKQTIRFLKPDMRAQGHYETNPILGKYPSKARLINAGIGYMLVHSGLSYCLGRKYQRLELAVSTGVIIHNHVNIGVRIDF